MINTTAKIDDQVKKIFFFQLIYNKKNNDVLGWFQRFCHIVSSEKTEKKKKIKSAL